MCLAIHVNLIPPLYFNVHTGRQSHDYTLSDTTPRPL